MLTSIKVEKPPCQLPNRHDTNTTENPRAIHVKQGLSVVLVSQLCLAFIHIGEFNQMYLMYHSPDLLNGSWNMLPKGSSWLFYMQWFEYECMTYEITYW